MVPLHVEKLLPRAALLVVLGSGLLGGCERRLELRRPVLEAVVAAPGASAVPPDATRRPGESVLFGVIHRRGLETCVDQASMTARWSDLFWSAGFVALTGDERVASSLHQRPAMLFGEVSDELPVVEVAPNYACGAQMRSDWVTSPDGILLRRGPSPSRAFKVRAGTTFEGLRARLERDELVIELANPLDDTLNDARVVVHYEGCYGKPGVETKTLQLGTIARAAVATARAPVIATDPAASGWRNVHRAVSVEVTGAAPGALFDLDVALEALSVRLECPKK